jgi:hypothetical protein
MPTTLLPRLLAVLATIVLLGVGLTTYTLPNHGGAAYGDLHDLITRALGEREPRLPGPPGTLPITTDATLPPMTGAAPDSLEGNPTPDWIVRAVEQDPAQLRAWLGSAVLATATVHGDTVQTTLWRLTLQRSCPLVSRMRATSIGRGMGMPRIVSLRADCPVIPDDLSRR